MESRKQKGFTLFEMVIATTIASIIIVTASNLLSQGFRSFITSKNIVNTKQQINVVSENMTRYLRSIRSPSDIISANNTSISFYDTIGNIVAYSINNSTLSLSVQGNSQPLAKDMQSLGFSYYDNNGASVDTSTNLTSIRYIVINLGSQHLVTTVYPWNLMGT